MKRNGQTVCSYLSFMLSIFKVDLLLCFLVSKTMVHLLRLINDHNFIQGYSRWKH